MIRFLTQEFNVSFKSMSDHCCNNGQEYHTWACPRCSHSNYDNEIKPGINVFCADCEKRFYILSTKVSNNKALKTALFQYKERVYETYGLHK